MTGKIIKGIGGFYYVHVPGEGVFECRARGVLRKDKVRPLIGDNVEVAILDVKEKLGSLDKLLPRVNSLVRPTVANIDQAVIVFAVTQPEPNYNLLDKFLVMIEANDIKGIICFNKIDILEDDKVKLIIEKYENTGYKVVTTSSLEGHGIAELKKSLYGNTTVFAGPSGVGKSSILNLIQDEMVLETGIVSAKIGRGKHTTRHAELICFHDDSYVVDTPGFSSLSIDDLDPQQIKYCFIEFANFEPYCKYNGCNHLHEPKCGVKDAVADGEISKSRYLSYTQLMAELNDIRKW